MPDHLLPPHAAPGIYRLLPSTPVLGSPPPYAHMHPPCPFDLVGRKECKGVVRLLQRTHFRSTHRPFTEDFSAAVSPFLVTAGAGSRYSPISGTMFSIAKRCPTRLGRTDADCAEGRDQAGVGRVAAEPATRREGRAASMNRGARILVTTLILIAVATALLVAYGSYRQYPLQSLVPPPASEQQNGVWLGHRWFSGEFTDAELSELVERIRDHHFAYLFVHAGPLNEFGRVPDVEGPGVVRLRAALAAAGLPAKILAWLGGKNADFGFWLDLDDLSTRRAIVQTTAEMLARNPMDGVHLDIEPIRSGDREFLLLLDEVRSNSLARGQMLSVATYQLRPDWIPGFVLPAWYTPEYMAAVARRVDQIAVMTYDTGMPLPGLYQRWVEAQVKRIVPIVNSVRTLPAVQAGQPMQAAPAGFSLLFGVPSYEEPRLGHWPSAENVTAASQALVAAFADLGGKEDLHPGYALYAEWTTDASEWTALERSWR